MRSPENTGLNTYKIIRKLVGIGNPAETKFLVWVADRRLRTIPRVRMGQVEAALAVTFARSRAWDGTAQAVSPSRPDAISVQWPDTDR